MHSHDDYVKIYDGDTEDATCLATLRSMPSNLIYHSSSNQMYIVMLTDSSGYNEGFQLKWGKGDCMTSIQPSFI